MKFIKKYYLLLLLIITLMGVSAYGTYAMFTSEIGIDAIKLEASNVPVDQEIIEYEKITINANDSKTISLNVCNSTNQTLHYGAWYQMVSPTTINDNITIAKLTDSPDETSGTIDGNSNKTIYIYIGNNSSSAITLYVGIKYSETSSLGLPDNRTLITDTRDGKYVVGVTVTNGIVDNGVTLTNLITNGSFEDGLNGWHVDGSSSSEGKVQSNIYVSGNYGYQGKSNINNQDNILWANSGPFTTSGHHYYVSQQIRNDANSIFVTHAIAGDTQNINFNVNNTNGKFIEVSDIAIADGIYNYFATAWNPGGSNGAYWYTDDIMTIDLTESYGSSYPSKEILDRSIGYFDGSVSYNYQKLNKGNSTSFVINPNSDYVIDSVTCTNSSANYNNNTLTVSNITGDVSCNVKFKQLTVAGLVEMMKNSVNNGSPNFGNSATTDEGIYQTTDDYGTSYYFRGTVTNNYVKFAGYYWRIIRSNGDGTIRMIYDGTVAHANGESSTDRQIGTSVYGGYHNNKYVGYMYGSSASNYEQTHTNTYNSTIKSTIDNWYKTNIFDKGYSDKVADVIYCNDRSLFSGAGYGSNQTIYSPYNRVRTNRNPSLICSQKNDAFTVDDISKGNGALTYPVGLITADEISFAGGVHEMDNRSYYLYTGQNYYTMSPDDYIGDPAVFVGGQEFGGQEYGLGDWITGTSAGVRPVLSLKSSVILTGSGTMTDPYVVQ